MDKNKSKEPKKDKYKKLIPLLIVLVLITSAIIIEVIHLNKDNINEEEKDLAYTELIKEIASKNVEKIEMTVGSTTAKVTLKGMEEGAEKTAILPNTQAFIELVQEQVAEGNEIELIQRIIEK